MVACALGNSPNYIVSTLIQFELHMLKEYFTVSEASLSSLLHVKLIVPSLKLVGNSFQLSLKTNCWKDLWLKLPRTISNLCLRTISAQKLSQQKEPFKTFCTSSRSHNHQPAITGNVSNIAKSTGAPAPTQPSHFTFTYHHLTQTLNKKQSNCHINGAPQHPIFIPEMSPWDEKDQIRKHVPCFSLWLLQINMLSEYCCKASWPAMLQSQHLASFWNGCFTYSGCTCISGTQTCSGTNLFTIKTNSCKVLVCISP